MITIQLNGEWSVRPEDFSCIGEAGLNRVRQEQEGEGWLPAQVPGEIHLDLMRAGQMPEPLVGANMPKCRWPETKSWWYRTTFELSEEFVQHERLHMIFDGLDLFAQVFVNNELVGEAANALARAEFMEFTCVVGEIRQSVHSR